MNILFAEIQPWEDKPLREAFPDAAFTDDRIDAQTVAVQNANKPEILCTFINSVLTTEVLAQLPTVRCIVTRSTGYDHIDVTYCRDHGIAVYNVPEYGSDTVAEHTFALILSLTRRIYQSVNQSKNLEFDHESIRGTDLCGKTLGIIGLGKIGANVLRIAYGFGMKVIVCNRSKNQNLQNQYGFEYVALDDLLWRSDIVTLHLPYSKDTHHIINKSNIVHMRQGAYLINTARGGLIETEAIVIALREGRLAGVGLDVLEEERNLTDEAQVLTGQYRAEVDMKNLLLDHVLIEHPRVLITPHNAFNSTEALSRITQTTITNILSYQSYVNMASSTP